MDNTETKTNWNRNRCLRPMHVKKVALILSNYQTTNPSKYGVCSLFLYCSPLGYVYSLIYRGPGLYAAHVPHHQCHISH